MEEARDQVEELRDDYENWLQQSPSANAELNAHPPGVNAVLNAHLPTHQTSSFHFAASIPVPRRAEPLVQAMLPKVELKTFSGVYAKWASWWSIFSVLVTRKPR